MRPIAYLAAATLLVSAAISPIHAGQPRLEILVGLHNAQGEQIGNVTLLEEEASGVLIRGKVSKLPPGRHAFHIHAVGKCEPQIFCPPGPTSTHWANSTGRRTLQARMLGICLMWSSDQTATRRSMSSPHMSASEQDPKPS
jgi:Cu/Zn superoxide dismutase